MSTRALDQRAATLESEGADPLRLDLLARARRFKRSWLEMAEALQKVRITRAYENWGYKDLYAYCAEELMLKRRTVDKLTGSYATIQQHAPQMLEREEALPTIDAVDYFRKAVESNGPREVMDELHEAVFEEAQPVTSLRRKFNPVLFVKSEDETQLATLERLNSAVKRLVDTLPKVDGLRSDRVATVAASLSELQIDLEELLETTKNRVEAA
jgi:hypothetical protein